MHEMTIADGILTQTLAAIADHGDIRVEQVQVLAGVLRQIVPEALELAWQELSRGTAAEGATLELVEVAPAARCRICECDFEPTIESYLCPQCNLADVEITAGNDIVLQSLTCQN